MRPHVLFIAGLISLGSPILQAQTLGQMLWLFDPGLTEPATPPALGDDGTIYYGVGSYVRGSHGLFYAFHPDGTKKWEFDVQAQPTCPAIAADGTVYVGTQTGHLLAITPAGTKLWEFASDLTSPSGTSPSAISSPAIAADGTLYLAVAINDATPTYRKSRLYALNTNGTERWRFNFTGWIAAPPVIGRDGTVYVHYAHLNGVFSLSAFRPDGHLLWDCTVNYGTALSIGQNDVVYVAGNSILSAVHPDGFVLWEFVAENSPLLHTFSLTGDHYLLGVRTFLVDSYGYLIWPGQSLLGATMNYTGESQAPLVGLDGTIYFGANAVTPFYAMSPNGSPRWVYFPTGVNASTAFTSSPVMNSKGVVYATTTYGRLYAFQGFGGPANTPWPMFQRDARHTGRAYDIPAVPPVLTGIRSTLDLGFLYTLTGEPGKTYTIQSSTNLATWTTLTNFTLSDNPTIHFLDPATTNQAARYFRSQVAIPAAP